MTGLAHDLSISPGCRTDQARHEPADAERGFPAMSWSVPMLAASPTCSFLGLWRARGLRYPIMCIEKVWQGLGKRVRALLVVICLKNMKPHTKNYGKEGINAADVAKLPGLAADGAII